LTNIYTKLYACRESIHIQAVRICARGPMPLNDVQWLHAAMLETSDKGSLHFHTNHERPGTSQLQMTTISYTYHASTTSALAASAIFIHYPNLCRATAVDLHQGIDD